MGVGLADIGAQSTGPRASEEEKLWRELIEISIARLRKIRGSNYVQLATVDRASIEARCRTVVFRGFQTLSHDHPCSCQSGDMSCVMRMCTDNRSQKVHQSSTAELVWWFPKSSEQYRVRGELIFVGGRGEHEYDLDTELVAARKQLWGNLSDAARESFFSEEIPGETFQQKDITAIPAGGRDSTGKVLPPPSNFLLMLLKPVHVDYLCLTGDQYRQQDKLSDGQWISNRVNP
jgi:hypothetical protein